MHLKAISRANVLGNFWDSFTPLRIVISGDPTHLQFFSYDDVQKLISNFFIIEEIAILKGGKLSKKFPKAFARNIAFRCIKKIQNN